ncbi:PAQR family membrane homeostasis protein TrhA [Robertkochia solimangrovi]|uniref:PAQR family membrane homeostasis protein TrhA n=1 Tax=Robertkochia solimangrovi TaxID=2213046 RepID=UPI00117E3DD9|nr:hemolysin III family protein [Robertkochia solimangrovi]TRZ43788.1 hemolysin III family protein [Robertkochia solimangrovi]
MDQTPREEIWNAVSHGVGILFALVGMFFLLNYNSGRSEYSTFSIVVYSLSMMLLFSASTIYHAVTNLKLKEFLRKLDHISIYFLIAGTYTPIALISLVGTSGWTIFWIVWSIAIVGTVMKIFFTGRFEKLSLFLYLAMGWLIVFDISNLITEMSATGLILMALGGAFYTLGTLFYAVRKIPYNHVIWHFFVLGGAVSHYFMVMEVI